MPNEILITDLVSQEAIEQLQNLDRRMDETFNTFKNCASELAKGLKIPVEVTGDLDKLRDLSNSVMRQAGQATEQLTQQLQEQKQVIAQTTNAISRELAQVEKDIAFKRQQVTIEREALDMADKLLNSREANIHLMAQYDTQLKQISEERRKLNEQEKNGLITTRTAVNMRANLLAEESKVKTAKQELQKVLTNETKLMNAEAGSYQQLSLTLERLKMALKSVNLDNVAQDDKRGIEQMQNAIRALDAQLKDMSADMGEFQRNVGNYAIAGEAVKSVKAQLKELQNEIAGLELQYRKMTDAEKSSAAGQELQNKITSLTEEASVLKDTVSDVKQSISRGASDTRFFDTIMEAGSTAASVFGLCTSAAKALGISEEDLAVTQAKLQAALQATSALGTMQNTLQEQSNLMKGVAIVQTKALAAAERIHAAASASATGATKAQTIAQAAFNAVAKANPYVLLATAIVTVVGLIAGYIIATKGATEADKAAAEAAELRKQSEENLAQTYSSSAGELIAKYKMLREQWNALGHDLDAKRQYLEQNKSDFEKIAQAADGAKARINDVNDVEKLVADNTGRVEAAIKRRAKAMAAYAEYIRLTQLELQELEKLSTFTYKNYKAGDMASLSDVRSAGIKLTKEQQETIKYSGYGGGMPAKDIWLTAEQAAKMTAYAKQAGNEAALAAMKTVSDKYDKQREFMWKQAVNNGVLEPANFSGGSKSSSKSSSSAGSKNTGSSGKPEQVKEVEEIKAMIDKIILDAVNGQVGIAEEGTEEWAELQKAALEEQRKADVASAEKKKQDTLAELQKTHEAGKMDETEYQHQLLYLNEATAQVISNINEKAKQDALKVDDAVLKHKEELVEKELGLITARYDKEQSLRNTNYQNEITSLYKEYEAALRVSRKNGEDTERITEEFNRRKLAIDNKFANETVQAAINALEEELNALDLGNEKRVQLQEELAKERAKLAQQMADQEKASIDEVTNKSKQAKEERLKNLEAWMNKAEEAIDKVTSLVSTLYDAQIEKIEKMAEVEDENYSDKVEKIETLAERGAITEEEAEIRKQAAKATSERKQEELEKKMNKIKYKQAVAEKANNIAQIGIATALGIMKASPNWVNMALVAAMGAVQTAVALAQPISAYKEGTKGKPHEGGLAIVGEGGKHEVIKWKSRFWVTPDQATLIDLPMGAEVFPDADKVDLAAFREATALRIPTNATDGSPVIINDYGTLEDRMANNTKVVSKNFNNLARHITREMKRQSFRAYIDRRT